jgi:uncharacterized protein (TIGR01244 family)
MATAACRLGSVCRVAESQDRWSLEEVRSALGWEGRETTVYRKSSNHATKRVEPDNVGSPPADMPCGLKPCGSFRQSLVHPRWAALRIVGTVGLFVALGGCAAKSAEEPRRSIPQPTPRQTANHDAGHSRTPSSAAVVRTTSQPVERPPALPAPRVSIDAVRVTEPAVADEFNNIFALGDLYLAGWPTEAGLKAMAARGVQRVVSLKTADEVTFARHYDPRAAAARLGIEWIELPVHPETYGLAEVAAFVATLETSKGPLLVHCGSASTSAMVWSGYLASRGGMTFDEIMAAARSAGLLEGPMTEAAERVVRQLQATSETRAGAPADPRPDK